MDREHRHAHTHGTADLKGPRLLLVILLNFVITAAEVIGGIYAGSLSLVSDALHNLSDGLAMMISYFAVKISGRQIDIKRTFGYRRASIMAALINAAVLVGISIFLFKEAYERFVNPETVKGGVVIWVALIGLAANALGVFLLQKMSKGDMNIKSAYLHLLADTFSSVAVIAGGVLIVFFKIYWVDPLLTVLISLYILKESIGILRDAVNILMQGVPKNLDIMGIIGELKKTEGVEDIHHVHVWCMDEKNVHFEAHVNVTDMPVSDTKRISETFERTLHEHGINHFTFQYECKCCPGADVIGHSQVDCHE
jgi:cobalt-zinc-cadmium efflux system protein